MRSDDALLLDMLIAARKIVRFSAGLTLDTFEADEMAQSAVIRELQVIGEAARLVSEDAKTAYSAIDWRTIAGMRNRLVHEYFAIRLDVVWQTAIEDVPPLIDWLNNLLPRDEEVTDVEEPASDD